MSELLDNIEIRRTQLHKYLQNLYNNKNTTKNLYNQYEDYIKIATPHDILWLVDRAVKDGLSSDEMKTLVSKMFNIFFHTIEEYKIDSSQTNLFLKYMSLENDKILSLMEEVKREMKSFSENSKSKLLEILGELKKIEFHYKIKQNILFPILEKSIDYYRCTGVMWSVEDDSIKSINSMIDILKSDNLNKKEFFIESGKLFFSLWALIQREEYVLYPFAEIALDENLWNNMFKESIEIGFNFVDVKVEDIKLADSNKNLESKNNKIEGEIINFETGNMTIEEIELVFGNLRGDVSFIDENDEVRFFSNQKERVFVRSKAIIGRKVQNCHPPDSVHIVEKILKSFRSGEKDSVDFWLNIGPKFIYIEYIALRYPSGKYRGTLEIVQDMTKIRSLKGDKRLLDF